jgi:tRNA modification GTPase
VYFRSFMTNYLRSDLNDTICALATPEGIGAIGVIRISGDKAIEMVDAVFKGKVLKEQSSHTAHFGRIVDSTDKDSSKIIDEVLATLFIAPKSYTGENTVEISCHGSAYIQQQILQTLIKQGARSAKPGEFTMRAFLNKKLDLTQAEAVADLIASNSEGWFF